MHAMHLVAYRRGDMQALIHGRNCCGPASTSAAASSTGSSCLAAPLHHPVPWGRPLTRRWPHFASWNSRSLSPIQAKRGRRSVDEQDDEPSRGFAFERRAESFKLKYNSTEVELPEQTLWLTVLAVLGLGVVIGPIVVGVAVMATSLAVAASFGAIALSTMFLPMIFFMLMFGGFFGSFALLGVGLFVPKLIGLVATGGALALGWSIVRMVIPSKSTKADLPKASRKENAPAKTLSPEEEEARREAKRIKQELKEFDALLERRSKVGEKDVDKFGRY